MSDLVAVGRRLGVQEWDDPLTESPTFLMTFELTEVLAGEATTQAPNLIQVIADEPMPNANVSDIDHMLLLINRSRYSQVHPGDEYLYYLTDGYPSIFGNIDGKVVTPEYSDLKRAYGDNIYSIPLDGTLFEELVSRVTNGPQVDKAGALIAAVHGFFAC